MTSRERALDTLQSLLSAVTQSGPGAADLDIDHEALTAVVHDAAIVLREAGRLVP